jgi:hypothetical protein
MTTECQKSIAMLEGRAARARSQAAGRASGPPAAGDYGASSYASRLTPRAEKGGGDWCVCVLSPQCVSAAMRDAEAAALVHSARRGRRRHCLGRLPAR